MTTVTAAPMRTKIRKVRDAALTYATVRPPEATRRTPITVSCPSFTGSPPGSRLAGQRQVNVRSINSNLLPGGLILPDWAGGTRSPLPTWQLAVRRARFMPGGPGRANS
jgi:hypothetical protein